MKGSVLYKKMQDAISTVEDARRHRNNRSEQNVERASGDADITKVPMRTEVKSYRLARIDICPSRTINPSTQELKS